MLSYQHEYHAGNHADVLKHAVLVLCLESLLRKDKSLRVYDAHAGSGIYDLRGAEARKTAEADSGIVRLCAAAGPPPALDGYLGAVRACNRGSDVLRRYPGSPALIRHLLRPADHLVLLERHPRALALLRHNFTLDPQVHLHARDCHEGLPGLLPPPERRGLVLLDPSYEMRGEFGHTAGLLQDCHRRFAGGVYLLWYPLLRQAPAARLVRRVAASGMRPVLRAELRVEDASHAGLHGSGVLVVNPPYGLDVTLRTLVPWLWRTLAPEGRGGWAAEWLVPE